MIPALPPGVADSQFDRIDVEADTEAPTIHVLYALLHERSIILRPYPLDTQEDQSNLRMILQIRQKLIDWVADQALGEDKEVAEWVVLHAIARV